MPKRLFDRLTLFGRARLDVTIATGALRPTHGRYAVDLFHVSDPSRFLDEAVATLHELLNLGGRGHFAVSMIVPTCMRGPMVPGGLVSPQAVGGPNRTVCRPLGGW